MGRYGITIKNPDFTGVTFDSRYTLDEIKDELNVSKAQFCSMIINGTDKEYPKINPIKFVVNFIIKELEIYHLLCFKDSVEDDELYIDYIKDGESEWCIEDRINDYEDIIRSNKEEMIIYALADVTKTIDCDSKENIVNSVRVQIDNLLCDISENVEMYISYKIAKANFDKIVKEEENNE